MARAGSRGPAHLVLSASVARRYYLDGRSKTDIAEEFRLTRFKVARLLDAARESGLVRIEIGHPGEVDTDLSARLRTTLALRHAVVVAAPDEDDPPVAPDSAAGRAVRKRVGATAAELLAELVEPDDVLGLGWARTVGAMAAALTRLPPVPVVQLTGALWPSGAHDPDAGDSTIDVVRRVARLAGGPAAFFHSPLVVPDAATARALRRQPDVTSAFARFDAITVAVVGIGRWAPGQSTMHDALPEADRRRVAEHGVCGDVCGIGITPDGATPATALTERMIAMSADQLRAVPTVIGLAYGAAKAPAVRASVLSGMVDVLVADAPLARALLDG